MRRYEGMFLFDSAVAREWASIEREVRRLCDRINAELLACVKFDERKLAYEIKRRKRGTYVLTYFEAPPDRVADLEHDVRLSDLVLRVMVLKADHVPEEKLNELKTWPAETALQPQSGDGRRHDDGERGARGAHRDSRADKAAERSPVKEVVVRAEPATAEGPVETGAPAADASPPPQPEPPSADPPAT